MVDVYIDAVKCTEINDTKEWYRIDFKNDKDEGLILVLTEDNFIDLYNRMKRRCETRNLIPIYNKGGASN